MKLLCVLLLLTASESVQFRLRVRSTTINAASCSAADRDTAYAAAADGDTIVFPACAATTWATQWIISKAITVQGAGSGEIVGDSVTSMLVGTGSKAFTTQAGEDYVNGETITARYSNRLGVHSMTGTVTSYSGTTLTLNITSVTGSGTYPLWQFERNPASRTIITNGWAADQAGLIEINEDTGGSVTITGIRFQASTTLGSGWIVRINRVTNGLPVLIHDTWFDMAGGTGVGGIISKSNQGVIWDSTFSAELCAYSDVGCSVKISGAVGVADTAGGLDTSWTTAATWGDADTTGRGALYVEDNYFVAFWQSLSGCDAGARIVWRYNTINNSAIGGHGSDTSTPGVRYCEIYNNRFFFTNLNDEDVPYNVNNWINLRGGSAVIADNAMDNITSTDWGNKNEITMEIQNLRRLDSVYPCWGDGVHATYGSLTYPAFQQVGRGTYTGNNPLVDTGALDPVYIWNNTGTSATVANNYSPNGCAPGAADISTYIQLNRDYYLSARPGYTKYTYPHPLATP